jgi:hypothetical protein
MKQLLSILADDHLGKKEMFIQAHYWALVAFISNLSLIQADLAQGWCTRRCYERTRGIIFCALHWKAVKRRVVGGVSKTVETNSGTDKREDDDTDHEQERDADLGKVVNLMQ